MSRSAWTEDDIESSARLNKSLVPQRYASEKTCRVKPRFQDPISDSRQPGLRHCFSLSLRNFIVCRRGRSIAWADFPLDELDLVAREARTREGKHFQR